MRGRVVLGVLVCLLAGSPCAGQESNPRDGSCSQPPEFYSGKFKIREVRVQHPFAFLRFVRARLDGIPYDELPATGSLLDLEKINRGREAIEARQFLPSPVSVPMRLDVIVASLVNCRDGQLDVVYQIYSTQVMPVFISTFESRAVEQTEPQQSAGLDTHAAFRLVPKLHFDDSNRFQGGGELQWRLRQPWAATVSAEGRGSSTSRYIAAAVSGAGTTHRGPIARIEWQLDYVNSEEPTQKESLRIGRLAARFSASTRPLGKSPAILRFGASLEGGNQQSNYAGAEVASNTVTGSSYGSLKMYAGLTANTRRQAFAASYVLDLGTRGASTTIEYRRHVVDLSHSLFLPIGDHRELSLESRFAAGAIQTPGKIPLPQRFFGGNNERHFIAGDSWRIRANPVLRSFAANTFNLGSDGVGAEEFFSYNLTGTIPAWRRPLVPRDLTDERDFTDALDLELSSVPSLLAADGISKDANFGKAVHRLPALWDGLLALENAVNKATVPDGLATMRRTCLRRLGAAKVALRDFGTKQSAELFSLVNSMVDPGREMAGAVKACLDDLNETLGNPEVAATGKDLCERVGAIKESFDAIDMAKYEAGAESEIKPVRRLVKTMLYDLNLYSISPVFVFDVARIGAYRPGTAGGLRYAVGGGIRLTLVNSLNFTLGYAINPDRRPYEERGALFFGLSFRDLFQ